MSTDINASTNHDCPLGTKSVPDLDGVSDTGCTEPLLRGHGPAQHPMNVLPSAPVIDADGGALRNTLDEPGSLDCAHMKETAFPHAYLTIL